MSLLKAENLSTGYGSNCILQNLNFCVNADDYLYIVGENGSGKSTLMKTILSLIDPLAGTITFSDGLLKNEIGYLPQQTQIQKDFPASVREIVLSGFQNKKRFFSFYTAREKQEAMEIMKKLSIDNLASRCYRELSGGQQQRVLLARALCAASRLLLLDEPVSGLDPNVTQNMYSLIDQLHKEGMAIIMISHDIDAALKYATHILHIRKQPFFGTVEEYKSSEAGKLFLAEKGGL